MCLMEASNQGSVFEPSGYCPTCDYRMEAGVCPECGRDVTPRRLRSRPRGWVRRHLRAVSFTLAVAAGFGWFARTNPAIVIPYLPTFYLLGIQASDSELAQEASEELAVRYVAGKLSQPQITSFMKAWVEVKWDSMQLPNPIQVPFVVMRVASARFGRQSSGPTAFLLQAGFMPHALPVKSQLGGLRYEIVTHGATLDGNVVTMANRFFNASEVAGDQSYSLNPRSSSLTGVGQQGGLAVTPLALGARLQLMPARRKDVYELQLDSVAVVTDGATGKTIAKWPLSHSVRITWEDFAERESLRIPEPGTEDLLYPYGKIPGESDPSRSPETPGVRMPRP